MQYIVKTFNPLQQKSACIIIGVFADQPFSTHLAQLDIQSGGHIKKAWERSSLSNERGRTLLLHHVPKIKSEHVLLVACGKSSAFNEQAFQKVIAAAAQLLKDSRIENAINCLVDLSVNNRALAWKIRQIIEMDAAIFYRFNQFKTKQETPNPVLHKIIFAVSQAVEVKAAQQAIREGTAIVAGMQLVKDLGNMPANICTPAYLAKQAETLAKQNKTITVKILSEKEMRKLGMGALLAVAQGSEQPAKLITLQYRGTQKNQKPYVLIGKGVTFDSGGISLKPANGMEEMKFDMCGAATVLGVMKTAAALKLSLNMVGIIPATENLPSGTAVKPGDVVTTLSGQTVEIINTDAEGRLILCDALTYSERFKPAAVIDIATLTGAIILTLGAGASGLMSNHQPLADALRQAGEESLDRVWQLPLWDEYQALIESNVADISNVGIGNEAKSIAAACFLARFANKFHWAHLDIAGTAWRSGKNKAASGRPLSLLIQYLLNISAKIK